MQTKNRQSSKQRLTNANYTAWSKLAVTQHSLLKLWQENQRLVCALTVLPLSLLMSACATRAPVPCEPLPVALRPALQYPLPTVSYSLTAAERMESWRLKLASTLSTYESSLTPPKKD